MTDTAHPPIEGRMAFAGGTTWYRITGPWPPRSRVPPLMVLHGGPGSAHDYLDSLTALATGGRAVIHYDQFGCGRSTHRPGADPAFWQVGLFVEELAALISHLRLDWRLDAYDILGQSWGGMLAAEHAVRRPMGLRRLVISNSPANMRTWVAEANVLRAALPAPVQETLLRHERDRTTGDPAYQQAVRVFYDRHLCRIPWPEALARSFAQTEADPTVYYTMNGPSEFHCIGHIKDWCIEDRLGAVAVPALVLRGEHDEATEACIRPYVERIAGARAHVFPGASHLPHLETPAAYLAVVDAFLRGGAGANPEHKGGGV